MPVLPTAVGILGYYLLLVRGITDEDGKTAECSETGLVYLRRARIHSCHAEYEVVDVKPVVRAVHRRVCQGLVSRSAHFHPVVEAA